MNISLMNDGNIYFLGFIFSPKLRTLSCGDTLYQLRKKESDVLALLCERYPHPVSQDDFLSCVWEGGYVTSQSIAQVIRALRRNLQDKDKQIIVTIPKLGYRFGVTPSFDEPQAGVVEDAFSTHPEVETLYTAQYDTSCGQFVYDRTSLINLTSIPVNSLAISPCVRPKKKNMRLRNAVLVVVFIITAYLLWYLTKNSMTSGHSVVIEQDGEVHSSEWTNQR
ncbi:MULTISPECIES: transcriptional regulator [unclassified Symbiopectobacterium]|uniref:transcriptional regulator n=1 Tax=unclassified Symbiopectobacterium TaxID=2794573 RepID=UPI0022267B4D|nr:MULTISPECIES: winged helix-turn-helix domain-containing protein [unclassified Symbiopectobacterium]